MGRNNFGDIVSISYYTWNQYFRNISWKCTNCSQCTISICTWLFWICRPFHAFAALQFFQSQWFKICRRFKICLTLLWVKRINILIFWLICTGSVWSIWIFKIRFVEAASNQQCTAAQVPACPFSLVNERFLIVIFWNDFWTGNVWIAFDGEESRRHHFFCYAFQVYRGNYRTCRLFFSF
jgi:hypothetical protein